MATIQPLPVVGGGFLSLSKPNPIQDLERQQQQVKDWWRSREKREPEPVPDTWAEAVFDAAQLALAHFMEQGNKAAVKRLPRAQRPR